MDGRGRAEATALVLGKNLVKARRSAPKLCALVGAWLLLHARLSHKPPAFRSVHAEKMGHASELPQL